MSISNRAYTLIVVLLLILLILLGVWVVKFVSSLRVESEYYKYDNNLDSKIDIVVEQGGEALNQVEANEIETNRIKANQIETNTVQSNTVRNNTITNNSTTNKSTTNKVSQ